MQQVGIAANSCTFVRSCSVRMRVESSRVESSLVLFVASLIFTTQVTGFDVCLSVHRCICVQKKTNWVLLNGLLNL